MPDLGARAEARLRLNRSERVYLALEGVAGAIGQVHVLRFREPHTDADLRAAVRHLVRVCPRLRSLIQPTVFGHRLRVLAEGSHVDALFELVFRAVPGGGGPSALNALLIDLVNQPFDLERALPLRARVLRDGGLPILVLSLHHVVCDGRGMMILLDALMARLNGAEIAAIGIDDPRMLPALLPSRGETRWAPVTAWWRSFRTHRHQRTETPATAVTLTHGRGDFGPTGVHLHAVAGDLAAIKAAAQARGCTVSELMIAALACGFARQATAPPAVRIASVRVSVDLRRFFPAERRPQFGNYVASFILSLPRFHDLEATITDVRTQMRAGIARFARKEMIHPLLLEALAPVLLGRRLFGWCARRLKRKGRLRQVTLHYSNLGGVDFLNQHGPHAQLDQLAFFTPALGPYVGCVGLAGHLYLGVTYPASEIDAAVIAQALRTFDALWEKLGVVSTT